MLLVYTEKEGKKLFSCGDGRLRSFASFGNNRSFKIYKRLHSAIEKAIKIKGVVAKIPLNVTVNAAGQLSKEVDLGNGYNRIEHLKIEDHLVYGEEQK
jgi:hypothetical protein